MQNGKESKNILIVDDDFSARLMLQLALRQAGYQVRSASSGEEAVQFLQKEHFDRMVTDGKMEPMDGFKLSLKAKELDSALRIAMVSAAYSEKDIQGYPIEKVFTKPIPVESIVAWLQDSATA